MQLLKWNWVWYRLKTETKSEAVRSNFTSKLSTSMYSMATVKIGKLKYQFEPSLSKRKKLATMKTNEIRMLQKEELWVTVYQLSKTMQPKSKKYPVSDRVYSRLRSRSQTCSLLDHKPRS